MHPWINPQTNLYDLADLAQDLPGDWMRLGDWGALGSRRSASGAVSTAIAQKSKCDDHGWPTLRCRHRGHAMAICPGPEIRGNTVSPSWIPTGFSKRWPGVTPGHRPVVDRSQGTAVTATRARSGLCVP